MEWPAVIRPYVTTFPACTTDLVPTIAELAGLPGDALLQPLDGISLVPLFERERGPRPRPSGFRYRQQAAWVDHRWKLIMPKLPNAAAELYDLETESAEHHNRSREEPAIVERMKVELLR